MKKIVSLIAISVLTMPAVATPAGRGRPSMASQMIMAAPRVSTVSTNQIEAMATDTAAATAHKSSVRVEPDAFAPTVDGSDAGNGGNGDDVVSPVPEKPNRDKERAACLNNNIGLGNTFVWASRFSNVASYHSMIEDIENPENNTCFVRVEMRSADSRVNVDDIQAKYFEMGTPVTCGAWADEETMRKRILDAKKTARVWATVGATVGGAGLGVGIMELFGNKLIGGKVQGQKALEGSELLRSQMLTMKDKEPTRYAQFRQKITMLVSACEDTEWIEDTIKPAECNDIGSYKAVLNSMS